MKFVPAIHYFNTREPLKGSREIQGLNLLGRRPNSHVLNDIVFHNSLELNWSSKFTVFRGPTPLSVATSAAAARWRWRVGAPVASSARFSWLRYQDFLVRSRRLLLLLLLRRRRDAHIPNAAVSVLRVAIVRVCVMWVHLRAPATGERLPSSLPRPSVGPRVRERVSKRVSSTCSLARCSVSRKPREGTEGEGAPTPTPTRASVVTWVGSRSQRLHCSQVPRRPRRRRRRQCRCRQRRSVVRSVGERGAKREIFLRPRPVRPRVRRPAI